jgi:hypothetical protein
MAQLDTDSDAARSEASTPARDDVAAPPAGATA